MCFVFCRSEELESAFIEMVQEDNRMELAAKVFYNYSSVNNSTYFKEIKRHAINHAVYLVQFDYYRLTEMHFLSMCMIPHNFLQVEKLEKEVAELRQVLSDKKEGEKAMLEVIFPLLFQTLSYRG